MEQDVDEELRRQMLSYGYRHDPQTGLLNRQGFQGSLGELLQQQEEGDEVALIWIDLINLRREFFLWGWDGIDALVGHVASTLQDVVGSDALLGRCTGHSFQIAVPAAKFDREARNRIQSMIDALSPLLVRGTEIKLETAAGVAFFPSDTESAEELVRFASMAAMRGRALKSNAVLAFQAGMNSLIVRDHQLEVEMTKGFDRGLVSLVYQPKIDLNSGMVLGVEALLRWKHPEWGVVAPSEFIPIAERSDLIQRVFDFSLEGALRDTRRWMELGIAPPVISVNASAANVRREDFLGRVRRFLKELPIAPIVLELEVTESLLFDDEEVFTTRMRQLREIGVRIAIDDFGTRYTGFNLLKQLPLETMKIDQCFIRGIHLSPDMRALCNTIVAMARQMRLRTVAEGIEEQGELEAMRQAGCEAGQGFLFQHPVTSEEFVDFLREWPARIPSFGFVSPCAPRDAEPLCGMA